MNVRKRFLASLNKLSKMDNHKELTEYYFKLREIVPEFEIPWKEKKIMINELEMMYSTTKKAIDLKLDKEFDVFDQVFGDDTKIVSSKDVTKIVTCDSNDTKIVSNTDDTKIVSRSEVTDAELKLVFKDGYVVSLDGLDKMRTKKFNYLLDLFSEISDKQGNCTFRLLQEKSDCSMATIGKFFRIYKSISTIIN